MPNHYSTTRVRRAPSRCRARPGPTPARFEQDWSKASPQFDAGLFRHDVTVVFTAGQKRAFRSSCQISSPNLAPSTSFALKYRKRSQVFLATPNEVQK